MNIHSMNELFPNFNTLFSEILDEVFYKDEPLHINTSPKTSTRMVFRLIKNYCYNYVLTAAYLTKSDYNGPLGIAAQYGQIVIKNPWRHILSFLKK